MQRKLKTKLGSVESIKCLLGLGLTKPYLKESMDISYLQILGGEINKGVIKATKCINPENPNIYVIELENSPFKLKYLYPKDLNTVNGLDQVLFYVEGQVDPKEVFKTWVDGQILLENNRHKILLNRYENLKKGIEGV